MHKFLLNLPSGSNAVYRDQPDLLSSPGGTRGILNKQMLLRGGLKLALSQQSLEGGQTLPGGGEESPKVVKGPLRRFF